MPSTDPTARERRRLLLARRATLARHAHKVGRLDRAGPLALAAALEELGPRDFLLLAALDRAVRRIDEETGDPGPPTRTRRSYARRCAD